MSSVSGVKLESGVGKLEPGGGGKSEHGSKSVPKYDSVKSSVPKSKVKSSPETFTKSAIDEIKKATVSQKDTKGKSSSYEKVSAVSIDTTKSEKKVEQKIEKKEKGQSVENEAENLGSVDSKAKSSIISDKVIEKTVPKKNAVVQMATKNDLNVIAKHERTNDEKTLRTTWSYSFNSLWNSIWNATKEKAGMVSGKDIVIKNYFNDVTEKLYEKFNTVMISIKTIVEDSAVTPAKFFYRLYKIIGYVCPIGPVWEKISIPSMEMPNIKMPTIEMPNVWIFTMSIPEVGMPNIKMPEINMPTMPELPEISMPGIPSISMPEMPQLDISERCNNMNTKLMAYISKMNLTGTGNISDMKNAVMGFISDTKNAVMDYTSDMKNAVMGYISDTEMSIPARLESKTPEFIIDTTKISSVSMPEIGMPTMPEIAMPNMPEIAMPTMPEIAMPNMPEIGMPVLIEWISKVGESITTCYVSSNEHILKAYAGMKDDFLKAYISVNEHIFRYYVSMKENILKAHISINEHILKCYVSINENVLRACLSMRQGIMNANDSMMENVLRVYVTTKQGMMNANEMMAKKITTIASSTGFQVHYLFQASLEGFHSIKSNASEGLSNVSEGLSNVSEGLSNVFEGLDSMKSNVSDYAATVSNKTSVYMPDIRTIIGMPDMPSLPTVEMPSMPKIEMPSLPIVEMPSLPTMEMPSLPEMWSISTAMHQMPNMPSIDTIAFNNYYSILVGSLPALSFPTAFIPVLSIGDYVPSSIGDIGDYVPSLSVPEMPEITMPTLPEITMPGIIFSEITTVLPSFIPEISMLPNIPTEHLISSESVVNELNNAKVGFWQLLEIDICFGIILVAIFGVLLYYDLKKKNLTIGMQRKAQFISVGVHMFTFLCRAMLTYLPVGFLVKYANVSSEDGEIGRLDNNMQNELIPNTSYVLIYLIETYRLLELLLLISFLCAFLVNHFVIGMVRKTAKKMEKGRKSYGVGKTRKTFSKTNQMWISPPRESTFEMMDNCHSPSKSQEPVVLDDMKSQGAAMDLSEMQSPESSQHLRQMKTPKTSIDISVLEPVTRELPRPGREPWIFEGLETEDLTFANGHREKATSVLSTPVKRLSKELGRGRPEYLDRFSEAVSPDERTHIQRARDFLSLQRSNSREIRSRLKKSPIRKHLVSPGARFGLSGIPSANGGVGVSGGVNPGVGIGIGVHQDYHSQLSTDSEIPDASSALGIIAETVNQTTETMVETSKKVYRRSGEFVSRVLARASGSDLKEGDPYVDSMSVSGLSVGSNVDEARNRADGASSIGGSNSNESDVDPLGDGHTVEASIVIDTAELLNAPSTVNVHAVISKVEESGLSTRPVRDVISPTDLFHHHNDGVSLLSIVGGTSDCPFSRLYRYISEYNMLETLSDTSKWMLGLLLSGVFETFLCVADFLLEKLGILLSFFAGLFGKIGEFLFKKIPGSCIRRNKTESLCEEDENGNVWKGLGMPRVDMASHIIADVVVAAERQQSLCQRQMRLDTQLISGQSQFIPGQSRLIPVYGGQGLIDGVLGGPVNRYNMAQSDIHANSNNNISPMSESVGDYYALHSLVSDSDDSDAENSMSSVAHNYGSDDVGNDETTKISSPKRAVMKRVKCLRRRLLGKGRKSFENMIDDDRNMQTTLGFLNGKVVSNVGVAEDLLSCSDEGSDVPYYSRFPYSCKEDGIRTPIINDVNNADSNIQTPIEDGTQTSMQTPDRVDNIGSPGDNPENIRSSGDNPENVRSPGDNTDSIRSARPISARIASASQGEPTAPRSPAEAQSMGCSPAKSPSTPDCLSEAILLSDKKVVVDSNFISSPSKNLSSGVSDKSESNMSKSGRQYKKIDIRNNSFVGDILVARGLRDPNYANSESLRNPDILPEELKVPQSVLEYVDRSNNGGFSNHGEGFSPAGSRSNYGEASGRSNDGDASGRSNYGEASNRSLETSRGTLRSDGLTPGGRSSYSMTPATTMHQSGGGFGQQFGNFNPMVSIPESMQSIGTGNMMKNMGNSNGPADANNRSPNTKFTPSERKREGRKYL